MKQLSYFFSKKLTALLFASVWLLLPPLEAKSPFAIDFPITEKMTLEDYRKVEELLHKIDVEPLIKKLYDQNGGFTHFGDFFGRCSHGVSQNLLDPEKKLCPFQ